MYLLCFGIFVGMIVAIVLMCVWGLLKNDDNDKGTNKDIPTRNNNMGISNTYNDRKYWRNNNNDLRQSKNDPEIIIEDLIICDMLGIL